MPEKISYLKDKKLLFIVGTVVFFIAYFFIFFNVSNDSSYSAKDLQVKTIDNKKEFEDKIVKNIYNKISDSCKPEKISHKQEWRDIDIMNDDFVFEETSSIMPGSINAGAVKGVSNSIRAEGSADFVGLSDTIGSIDFDGNSVDEKTTEGVSFSKTNIQKQKVDEGDILKQTKDYIFYFSKEKSKIYVIKSPMNENEIDLENIEAVHTINIPDNLTIKPELFVSEDRLVYLASKKSYNNNNTIVGIYDISDLENKKIELFKKFETKGDYFKSRLIDNNLYLISDYSLDPFKNKYCNVMAKDKSSGFVDFLNFFTGLDLDSRSMNKELYDELKEELETYSYKLDKNSLNSMGTPELLSDFKIFYTDKDLKEPIENLNFNIMSVVDIGSNESENKQSLIFGNLKDGEIHMTLDNLYLVNSYFQDEKWKCDYIDICHKQFSSNNFTSISKIGYTGNELEYKKTSIIPGKPINQYSMDEDQGYFRIFTAHGSNNRDAALYVFDTRFKLIGELEDIKPGEEFKSSRFIGDKAYLVTFRQKDPLFVIDLHIPATPKIIGELHIPGYSSYLHPYGKVGSKEYLIGLGRESNDVKVDLYEIDFDKVNIGGQVNVIQKYKYIFEGSKSETPAETNPRAFVWDKDDKILYLPIDIIGARGHIVEPCEELGGTCKSIDGKLERRLITNHRFTGIKALNIEVDSPIKEVESHDTNKVNNISNVKDSRVGYYKTQDDKALFFVEGGFIEFFGTDDNSEKVNFY